MAATALPDTCLQAMVLLPAASRAADPCQQTQLPSPSKVHGELSSCKLCCSLQLQPKLDPSELCLG